MDVVVALPLGALGGGIFVASVVSGLLVEAEVARCLHKDHRTTWVALGRPAGPLPSRRIPGSRCTMQTRGATNGAMWRWAWRLPRELHGDARLQGLARAYVATFWVGLTGWLVPAGLFFLASNA